MGPEKNSGSESVALGPASGPFLVLNSHRPVGKLPVLRRVHGSQSCLMKHRFPPPPWSMLSNHSGAERGGHTHLHLSSRGLPVIHQENRNEDLASMGIRHSHPSIRLHPPTRHASWERDRPTGGDGVSHLCDQLLLLYGEKPLLVWRSRMCSRE